MSNTFKSTKDYIDTNINTNGNRGITGSNLNTALNKMLVDMDSTDTYTEEHAVYGVQWTFDASGNETFTRLGDAAWHKILPVQRRLRGCVLKVDGTVNYYLDPNDWSKKLDGTATNLTGQDGNVMVEIPTFWYKYTYSGEGLTGTNRLLISLSNFDEGDPDVKAVKFPMQYVGAYKGSTNGTTKLQSIKGTYATVSTNLPSFRTLARNNYQNDKNWNVCTYEIHKIIWILFTVEYATCNSQAAYNTNLTADGYHQGGLGAGLSSGSQSESRYAIMPTGTTDDAGNSSFGGSKTFYIPTANNSYTASSISVTNTPCRYRGIENPFGEVWEWTDGIFFTAANEGYEIERKENFEYLQGGSYNATIADTCRSVGTPSTNSGVQLQKILGSNYCDLIADTASGDAYAQKYYADGWWNTPASFTGLLWGGLSGSGARDGLACAHASDAPSYSGVGIGSRLAYIPNPTKDLRELTDDVDRINETLAHVTGEFAVYGVQWKFDTSGNETFTRLGDSVWHQLLPVQSKMRGCVLKADGSVNYYLKADDWTKKEDGTASNLYGTDGNVMVEIPTFWYKYTYEGTGESLDGTNTLLISLNRFDDDAVEFKKQYIGAYKGSYGRTDGTQVTTSTMLGSVKGVYASVSSKLANFRTGARNNNTSINNWNLITYEQHKAIWILFTVEYATANSQATFNSQFDVNGFRQGGLGSGLDNAYWSDGSTRHYISMPTGTTDDMGNFSIGSKNYTYYRPTGDNTYTPSETTMTKQPCRYRGIENPFGEVWEWTDGIFFTSSNVGYEILDKKDFSLLGDSSYTGNVSATCRTIGTPESASGGILIKRILGSKYCDILPKKAEGSTSNGVYYSDGWWNTPASFTGLRWGGSSDDGASDGLACALAYDAPSHSTVYFGSRLVYIP